MATVPQPTTNPDANPDGAAMLAKYRHLGEDHPSYRKLKEALARGQSPAVAAAIAELEQAKPADTGAVAVPGSPGPARYWSWILLWGTFLAACLYALSHIFIASHVQEIIARNTRPLEFITCAALGGSKSEEITAHILKEIDELKPDECLFVGHQLAKKEIVEYLSALSQMSTVRLVLGTDGNGKCQLTDPKSPLRQYGFTEVRQSPMPIRTQMLLAFNHHSQKAVAFIGTYPYDLRDAATGEHALIVARGYDECRQIYRTCAPLLNHSATQTYGR